MTKYYINLILLILSLLGYTSINNLKVVATSNPNAVTTLFISEIAYDTHSLDYNQKCQPTDSKASCSFDKWFEIYNPSPAESVRLSDIYFSVNDGKNLNQIISNQEIKPQSFAVVHNSRVASGVLDTFKTSNTITSGKSGWVGSISGQNGSNYNVHLGLYYKDLEGNPVLINARNIANLPTQSVNLRKTIEFKSSSSDYTFAQTSFLQLGSINFFGNPSTGLVEIKKDQPVLEKKEPLIAKNPINQTTATKPIEQAAPKQAQSAIKPATSQIQPVIEINSKYAIESATSTLLNQNLARLKTPQQNLDFSLESNQLFAKSFKPSQRNSLNFTSDSFDYKFSTSRLFNSYSHLEVIFLDALILTLVGLKLINQSKLLKLHISQQN